MKNIKTTRQIRCRGRPPNDWACREGPPGKNLIYTRDGPYFALGRGQPDISARNWLWFAYSGKHSEPPDRDNHMFTFKQGKPVNSARDWRGYAFSGYHVNPPGKNCYFIDYHNVKSKLLAEKWGYYTMLRIVVCVKKAAT
ncbi:MAG: hypothetical protein Q8M23_08985 [Bacteroidales bacterium]|nr:hypothetical protein [Bacteroidales bacterium]